MLSSGTTSLYPHSSTGYTAASLALLSSHASLPLQVAAAETCQLVALVSSPQPAQQPTRHRHSRSRCTWEEGTLLGPLGRDGCNMMGGNLRVTAGGG